MGKTFLVIGLIYAGYFILMFLWEVLKSKGKKVNTEYEETYSVSDLDIEEPKNVDTLYQDEDTSPDVSAFDDDRQTYNPTIEPNNLPEEPTVDEVHEEEDNPTTSVTLESAVVERNAIQYDTRSIREIMEAENPAMDEFSAMVNKIANEEEEYLMQQEKNEIQQIKQDALEQGKAKLEQLALDFKNDKELPEFENMQTEGKEIEEF